MSKDVKVHKSNGKSPRHKKRNSRAMRNLILNVLGAIGALYMSTNSLAVTIIGAIAALIAAMLYLLLGRK